MKQKTLTIIIASIFLIGIVTAANFTNVNPLILDIQDFIAGGTTSTTFSFDYENDFGNLPYASLVLKVNISSEDENYPVWKGDFQLSGLVQRYSLFDLFLGTIYPLSCVEDTAEFKVQQGLLYTETNIPDGTFYCYDPSNYIDMLELDRRDKVNLSITSNPALYPGEYSVGVELMEMEPDNSPPEIEFMIDGDTFAGDEIIPIKLNVTDMYNIQTVQYKITDPELSSSYFNSGWIDLEFNETSKFYEDDFNITEYGLDTSGTYWIKAYACDVLGNCREM